MALEPWIDTVQPGDILSRGVLLDEIKANLVSILSDYLGKGDDAAETALIARAQTLFTGELVPSRIDWDIIVDSCRTLSLIKEHGIMYERFITDLSDSLGVSDLEKIQSFLDDIQRIAPDAGAVSVSLGEPARYYITAPTVNAVSDGNEPASYTVSLNWSKVERGVETDIATLTVTESPSEDIDHYVLTTRAGTFLKEETLPALNPIAETIPLVWNSWFDATGLKDAWMSSSLSAYDKRGNRKDSTASIAKYASGVFIAQGVDHYELQYSVNGGSYTTIYTGVPTNTTWIPPRVTGSYIFRIRAIDKNGSAYGGFDGTAYSDWAYSLSAYMKFLPDPPDAPAPRVETTWFSATITWDAVPRAEWYEVWMGEEQWSLDADYGGNNYWQRLTLDEARSVLIKPLNQGKTYAFHVRAGNAGGATVGGCLGTIKTRVLRTADYNSIWSNVFNANHTYRDLNGNTSYIKDDWYPTKNIYQGEWVDAPWGYTGWSCGRGGGYCAWGGQQWGNNMSFIYFDYGRMRNELGGKLIQSVTITLTRIDEHTHGWETAQPLYLYGHDRWQDWSKSSPNAFTLFHADKRPVHIYNQEPIANIQFNYGETENITNAKTKALIQAIVNGNMMGLGLVKFYGESFNDHAGQEDKAYMILKSTISIRVTYYDN